MHGKGIPELIICIFYIIHRTRNEMSRFQVFTPVLSLNIPSSLIQLISSNPTAKKQEKKGREEKGIGNI